MGSEDEDAPLAMSSIRPELNGRPANGAAKRHDERANSPEDKRNMNRSKSMVSLGSEEDLLKRRMKGLTTGLMGSSDSS